MERHVTQSNVVIISIWMIKQYVKNAQTSSWSLGIEKNVSKLFAHWIEFSKKMEIASSVINVKDLIKLNCNVYQTRVIVIQLLLKEVSVKNADITQNLLEIQVIPVATVAQDQHVKAMKY